MKTLAILMTVHNRKDKTLACLSNIMPQLSIEKWQIEIFITDDGCTDGTGDAIRNLYPDISIIEGDGNLFWNQGMRKAWKVAAKKDYDAYLWLNDDTNLKNDAIINILNSHKLLPNAIIVGSTQNVSGDKITYGGYNRSNELLIPNGFMQKCWTFNGNIVFIPKTVFQRVGFLDKTYTHSIGDIDYGLTAREYGFESYITPTICGTCNSNPTPPKWLQTNLPLKVRFSNLFSPLAYTNPPEYYHFKRKHWGHLKAILAMASIALQFISPKLWKKIRHIQ